MLMKDATLFEWKQQQCQKICMSSSAHCFFAFGNFLFQGYFFLPLHNSTVKQHRMWENRSGNILMYPKMVSNFLHHDFMVWLVSAVINVEGPTPYLFQSSTTKWCKMKEDNIVYVNAKMMSKWNFCYLTSSIIRSWVNKYCRFLSIQRLLSQPPYNSIVLIEWWSQ